MIANNIRKKGFTLIEILLIVFFIGLTSLGIYMMQGKTSDEVTISKEKEYILSLFDEIDRSASVLSRFQNISLQSLKDNGYISKTNGFELVSVNAPTPTRLEATYNNLKNKECSMFVSSIVNFSETYSARINNIAIPSKADPKNITLECSNNLNEVVIVRENNVFGVTLNTSLNGINNPIIGQNINACPMGVCNTMTPGTPVTFTPITVAVNKPSVTIPGPGAITTPAFTPGTPMVQPPVVTPPPPPVVTPPPPPVVTPPPPPVVTPPPPPVVTPPPPPVVTPPPPPVVTPPAGPTTPVTPPPQSTPKTCSYNGPTTAANDRKSLTSYESYNGKGAVFVAANNDWIFVYINGNRYQSFSQIAYTDYTRVINGRTYSFGNFIYGSLFNGSPNYWKYYELCVQ